MQAEIGRLLLLEGVWGPGRRMLSLVSMLCFFETCVNNPGSLLPYAMDARHAPVTLFIVSECDIRLYKEDCKEDRSAWGDQLASHMWPTAQDALDRTLKAAKETAARTAGRPADARAPSPSRPQSRQQLPAARRAPRRPHRRQAVPAARRAPRRQSNGRSPRTRSVRTSSVSW